MSTDTCGSDVAANTLYDNLVTAGEFSIPTVDLSDPSYQIPDYSTDPLFADMSRLTEADLTSREPRGNGMYDALMEANKAHLQEEFSAGRMTVSEYREAYVALTTAAMSSAVQYLLSKDQAYYQASLVQHQAQMAKINVIQSRVQLEETKTRLVEQQAATKTRAVQYALSKIQIASEDAKRCLTQKQSDQVEYETLNILPAQAAKITADTAISTAEKLRIDAQTAQITYETANLLPAQVDKVIQDTAVGIAQENLTASEKLRVDEQIVLLNEQVEVEHAKISDTLTDGVTLVAGVMKAEKDRIVAQTDQVSYQTTNLLPEELNKITAEVSKIAADVTVSSSEKLRIDAQTQLVGAQEAQVEYETMNLLPKQVDTATAQISKITAEKDQTLYQTASILPEQLAVLTADKNTKVYTVENLLPAQTANVTADTVGKEYDNQFIRPEQYELAKENVEATRAKTKDTRRDAAVINGSIGAQVALHRQQIESYKRDAEWKVAKGILDTWITQKSLDDGLIAPTSIQDGAINSVMTTVRTNLGI